ncbi:hypothetical protein TrispH2_003210 [Trichoplax sp. H2]|nr:hypothetical protein TrispH2_003210 [Trichoplax sp. H2]|eukprot:RDD44957.1 hypothetical protein TrispH2_003210 [Trichoplax sp. H2]
MLYVNGKLHSEKNLPGIIHFDENHTITEVQEYNQGVLHGDHIQYHPNERQSYQVRYVNGKKEGMEKCFNSSEGEYVDGKMVGKHWKKHENGTMAFLATYDKKGLLKEPIREFDENGQKIAEYSRNPEGQFHGKFQSWFSDGKLLTDGYYVNGELEGEYVQHFPSGQVKLNGNYKNQLKDGLFQEWYEDGKLAFRGTFSQGNRNGEFCDWYSNGQMKTQRNFKDSLFHGDQKD